MPHYHEGDKKWKTKLTSEVARLINPALMRPGSTVIAHDGAVYERMKNGSLKVITRAMKRKSKTK